MRKCVDRRLSVVQSDFTKPTDNQKYKLGERVIVEDTDSNISETWIYVKADTPVEKGTPLVMYEDGKVDVIAGPNIISRTVVIPQFDVAVGQYALMQYKGACQAKTSTPHTPFEYFKTTATEVEQELLSQNTIGYFVGTKTGDTAELVDVVLFGRQARAL